MSGRCTAALEGHRWFKKDIAKVRERGPETISQVLLESGECRTWKEQVAHRKENRLQELNSNEVVG